MRNLIPTVFCILLFGTGWTCGKFSQGIAGANSKYVAEFSVVLMNAELNKLPGKLNSNQF